MNASPTRRLLRLVCALLFTAATAGVGSTGISAQSRTPTPAQKLDADYTAKITAATADPRILTELVDHMPASDKVPSPLKFLGYIPGEPGKMTYYKDIVRYLEALDKASDRVAMFKIGVSDEGRDMVAVAIADEATIKQLDKYKQITAQLTDPRKLTDAQAKHLIATGRPIYFASGSIHSPETGSPEMLMELAYRLAIEESPFIQTIRNHIIFVFTPASEVDGREKQVNNFVAQQRGLPSPSMVYWGKYVQHDNNRDGIGVGLRLTQAMLKTFLDWRPTVWHDLHESVTLPYTSTGTGPYNSVVDPIQANEWWLVAQTEIMELTKRGVPGVWTDNYYDGWVPNYMCVTHNSIGRFYETQSYGGAVNRPLPVQQSREWYRPNPTPPDMMWGPRNNVNMQQSALLIAMNSVAKNKETFLENYYLKNKHTMERGRTKAPYAYVVPAKQRRPVEAAELMNLIPREGAEVHTADSAFSIGSTQVAAGDCIVRLDQPYGAIVETLLGVQFYAPENPRPYDDTGWAIPLVRNLKTARIEDKSILEKPMTLATADFRIAGTITGSGRVLTVDHNTENTLVTFRFQHAGVRMSAAEREFEAGGHRFAPGAFFIAEASRAALEPSIRELGLSAWAVDAAPNVGTVDSTDDMRGSIGIEGLMEIYKFIDQGGVLITEEGTSTIFPTYNLTPGVALETPDNLYVRGSVLKTILGDKTSPVLYGYDQSTLAVYFNQAPVMRVGGGAGGFGGGRGGFGGGAPDPNAPRVLLSFPANANDLLLSGILIGGDALAGRAVAIDAPIGKGHVVMFANRPYWRWQTQGNFFLGFNAILNWNDLDAGRTAGRPATTTSGQ